MKKNIITRTIAILIAFNTYCLLSAQSKMIMTVNNKENDILGYTLEPSSSGGSKEIDIFGPMQNAGNLFNIAYMTGNLIPEIDINITDASSGNTLIKLSQVKVEEVKQYVSTYSNGMFVLSSAGTVNTEIKCGFEKSLIQTGSTNSNNENLKKISSLKREGWELNANGLKGATGRLLVNLPADLPVQIMFYDLNDKYLRSQGKSDPVSFPPGEYNIKISGSKLKNVPVQKGMDTKIYAGILSIVSPSSWQVYDETKKEYLHSGSAPEKVGLPAGNYQLKVNGVFQPIVIKNGETTEF